MLRPRGRAKVLADAAAGKSAHLMLDAHEEEKRHRLRAARHPARPRLRQSPLGPVDSPRHHVTDRASVEDDGGLAILAVLHYYAQIPQADRPRA